MLCLLEEGYFFLSAERDLEISLIEGLFMFEGSFEIHNYVLSNGGELLVEDPRLKQLHTQSAQVGLGFTELLEFLDLGIGEGGSSIGFLRFLGFDYVDQLKHSARAVRSHI